MTLTTEPQPFTTKATRDWQLGEIAAQLGREPYPIPATEKRQVGSATFEAKIDQSAWAMGYHYAYQKVHGHPWLPPAPPKEAPEGAIMIAADRIIPTHVSRDFGNRLKERIIAYAVQQGVADAEHIIADVIVDFQCGHGTYAVGASVLITTKRFTKRFDTGRINRSYYLNFLKGELDLRPKLEGSFIEELKTLGAQRKAIAEAEQLQRENARLLQNEFIRAFGSGWNVSTPNELDARIIGSIQLFAPTNTQFAVMMEKLKTLPSFPNENS